MAPFWILKYRAALCHTQILGTAISCQLLPVIACGKEQNYSEKQIAQIYHKEDLIIYADKAGYTQFMKIPTVSP